MRYDGPSVESRIKKKCLPLSLREPSTEAFRITGIIPRLKDGGAFVKFISDNPKKVESMVQGYLKQNPIKPWFSPFTRVRTFRVRGKPWLEDLYRFPSSKLKVEFIGSDELSQEALYSLFRQYGKIADIVAIPPSSRDMPKSAIIKYLRIRSATSARNCLHGLTVPDTDAVSGKGRTVLRILYEPTLKVRWIQDWLFSHPRIVLPILAAIITTITIWVFDPIRTWFIQAKIKRSLYFSENFYWGWVKKNAFDLLAFRGSEQDPDGLKGLWDERKESIEKMNEWLQETEETFIVVHGPRGSRKREMVIDSVLGGRKNVLVIDCELINEAHGDSETIITAANQVGYRPVFSFLNTISSFLDLAAQGAIGTNAVFSQTLENQFTKIFQNTALALKRVALERKSENDRDAAMSDDEYLAANPQRRPVVVIDNFLQMEGKSMICEKLADWAALLVSANAAHVVFLTNDLSFSKALNKALPRRVFRVISLGDAQPESAKRYVLHNLYEQAEAIEKDEKLVKELDESIEALGGRLTDLDFLARRIKVGESPRQAVHEIIKISASEILKLYFLDGSEVAKRKWTSEQAWYLVERLASEETIRYNEVLFHDFFKSNDSPLQSLALTEMISIVNKSGRPYAIKAGKPVYKAAFKRLTSDTVLKAKMDYLSLKALVKGETAVIKGCEEEFLALNGMEKMAWRRVEYLQRKIEKCQRKIEDAEREMEGLKSVLGTEF
jgi:hypothetical protein